MNATTFSQLIAGQDIRRLKVMEKSMPADLETPVSAFLKLQEFGARILLESVESGTIVGRYSFICLQFNSKISINEQEMIIEDGERHTIPHHGKQSPLVLLREMLGRMEVATPASYPRLLGGAVGYISYDFVRFLERIPDTLADPLGLPLAVLYLVDTLLVFDHVQRKLKIMCLVENGAEEDTEKKLGSIIAALRTPLPHPAAAGSPLREQPLKANVSKEAFCNAVRATQKHIVAGDIYQLVLSLRFQGETTASPFTIYRALRMLNPSPYMFYLDLDDVKLIGSSPEALVRLEGDRATVRPIAGTRPRGSDEVADRRLEKELVEDEKERAEHVMLVDLGRNDLGRCCKFHSVEVPDFMTIERYSHVMHMTSKVTGTLSPGLDQFDLFQAAFPAGTVSGAPKIRAMELIEELENLKRGPYAGAVGYFSLSGDTDWCITIRTILMMGEKYFLQAGAGIVADSVPENEYTETRNKIAALRRAIEIAEGGLG